MKISLLNILRWFLFLPVAILTATAAYSLVVFIIRIFVHIGENLLPFYKEPDDNRLDIFGLIFGIVFVFIGTSIAPSNKKAVGFILYLIIILLCIVMVVMLIYNFVTMHESVSHLWHLIDPLFYFWGGYIAYDEVKKKYA